MKMKINLHHSATLEIRFCMAFFFVKDSVSGRIPWTIVRVYDRN